jgi:hypothetical protein
MSFSISDISTNSLGTIFDSICKLEPGNTKSFDIPLREFRGNTIENKKSAVKLMSSETLQITTSSTGRIENKTRQEAGKDYSENFNLK